MLSRNEQSGPTHPSRVCPVLTSYPVMVQYQNQKNRHQYTPQSLFRFPQSCMHSCVCVCVCVYVCECTGRGSSLQAHHTQACVTTAIRMFNITVTTRLLWLPSGNHTLPLPPPVPLPSPNL